MLTATSTYRGINRDLTQSLANVAKSPIVARDTAYYTANIGNVKSIDDFMANKRLMRYALTAFGLSDVAYAGALIRRVLEGGIDNPDAIANKLADQRYRAFVSAFNFVRYGRATTSFDATQKGTTDLYVRQVLEQNTGSVNEGARLALYFARQAPKVSSGLGLLADGALLKVTRATLGIADATSNLSIDAQQKLIEAKLNVADLKDPQKLDKFLARFMARWDAENSSTGTSVLVNSGFALGGVSMSTDLLSALQKLRKGT